jgi:hypothetical protein
LEESAKAWDKKTELREISLPVHMTLTTAQSREYHRLQQKWSERTDSAPGSIGYSLGLSQVPRK